MTLSAQIVLRYRGDGHLRFAWPPTSCTPAHSAAMANALRRTEGIYRVDWSARNGKLSVRYFPSVCDASTVARVLQHAADKPPTPELAACCAHTNLPVVQPQPTSWFASKAQEVRETTTALQLLAERGLGKRWLPELVQDTVVLYLIRAHWHLITQHWLVQPWRYRYELGTAFYLVYVFVRSRLPPKDSGAGETARQ